MSIIRRFFTLALSLLCLCMTACASTAEAADPVSMLFVNVGKADAALVWVGERTYLIDTADEDSYPALKAALDAYSVTHLDAVFISHIDKDHVGGLEPLLADGVAVDQLYAATLHGKKNPTKHPVYQVSETYGVPLIWLNAGDTVPVLDDALFRVLGPLTKDEENENNNSLVLLLETAQGTTLFPGDMELEEESALLAAGVFPRVDVLKVAHHGEDDASGELFIYTIRPKVAVTSTSTNEEADTPDPKVIARLWAVKSETYATQDATCGIMVRLSGGTPAASLVNYQDMR